VRDPDDEKRGSEDAQGPEARLMPARDQPSGLPSRPLVFPLAKSIPTSKTPPGRLFSLRQSVASFRWMTSPNWAKSFVWLPPPNRMVRILTPFPFICFCSPLSMFE